MKALQCNGSRVLTPEEVNRLRSVISKPSNRALFDLLLFTGLRLSEVSQVSLDAFDQERGVLFIRSGKAKATQRTRNVILSPRGAEAVKTFLKTPKIPGSPTAWQMNLIRWARQADLSLLPGHDQGEGGNPYGVTVRATRKTWESWLLTAYPDKPLNIALSQGHSETTALRHYLNVSFTPAERDEIRQETSGWGG